MILCRTQTWLEGQSSPGSYKYIYIILYYIGTVAAPDSGNQEEDIVRTSYFTIQHAGV